MTVVGALRHHVSKVHTFAEHVSSLENVRVTRESSGIVTTHRRKFNHKETHHWGLWRGNAQTLGQDTSVVGGARTVPQQLAVV